MIKLASLKVDTRAEREGQWVPIPDWPGVELLVRSTEYPPYKVAIDQERMKLARRHDVIPPEEMARVDGRLRAEHLLLGWRGLDEAYTPELALDTLTDPAGRLISNAVAWAASRVGIREVAFLDDLEKNSAAPSATS